MKLKRTQPHQRPRQRRDTVQSLLVLLGVATHKVYRNRNRSRTRLPRHGVSCSFWNLPAPKLWELLETASRNYRRLMREHHPDRGGCIKKTVQLNVAWGLVKRRFANRGFELN